MDVYQKIRLRETPYRINTIRKNFNRGKYVTSCTTICRQCTAIRFIYINDTYTDDKYLFRVDRGELGVYRIVVDIHHITTDANTAEEGDMASRMLGVPPGQVIESTETLENIRLVTNPRTSREDVEDLENLVDHDFQRMCGKLSYIFGQFRNLEVGGREPFMKKLGNRLLVKF